MTANAPDGQTSDAPTAGASRLHFVHVYTILRIKLAVDAPDHHSAMKAADDLLFANDLPVRFAPVTQAVLDAEYAEEVTGYLVDEADDDGFIQSCAYGPDYELEGGGS